ncbi:PAS domain-containing protein [Bradyrhizobium sp. LA6.12]|uniref:PAS domain-containing protein n=1 Tax=unclassified Bradyrhizobium TaxID=2631580 RepID=UPI00339988E0
MAVDVDEGKKAEHQTGYVAQLQATLNVIPAHTWYASRSGGLTFVNKRTADYLGLPKDHPLRFGIDVGAQWDAHLPFVHPDDRAETQENWATRLRTGEGGEGSFRVRNAQGGYRWFLSRAEPLLADDGTILQWVGVNLDIEDLKCAEEALRENERSLRLAIDGIAGLVAVLAPNGELKAANRQLFEYFGRSLEELQNWGTNDTVHPEDLPRIFELVKKGVASEIPFNFELRVRRFDGEYRWFENRHVPILDDSGRIARWYLLLTDIEDRTRALARFDQIQSDFAHMNRVSMMGELAASLSHEITQPIASARNNARAALNFLDIQPPDLGEVREALGCIVDDSDRAGNIIDRIRDQMKKAPPRKERFDLNAAIDEVIMFGQGAIFKNRVWVQTRLSEGLVPVHGDRVQLQQVVLNLLLLSACFDRASNLATDRSNCQSSTHGGCRQEALRT